MPSIKKSLKKVKSKYKNFKTNESGGDMINQILMLAIALVIIGLLLVFAIAQFEKVKEGFIDLFSAADNSGGDNLNILSQIKTQSLTLINDICNTGAGLPIDKNIICLKGILSPFFCIDSFNFIKSIHKILIFTF